MAVIINYISKYYSKEEKKSASYKELLKIVTLYINKLGRRKRILYLYVVTATNLSLLRANAETSHSVRVGPGSGCERYGRW